MKTSVLILLFFGLFPNGLSGFTSQRKVSTNNAFRYQSQGLALNLFFKKREEESLKKDRESAQARIPQQVFVDLQQKGLELPFQFNLVQGQEESTEQVTIRFLQNEDLGELIPICVDEFGDNKADFFQNFPWQKPMQTPQYVQESWENFTLPHFISFVLRLKLLLKEPKDYALLVATLQERPTVAPSLIGLVELSQQPPSGYNVPSAFPVPLWYKEMYCSVNKLPRPNGWITNLLVAPNYRGKGYSKLLMAATEGLARNWGCTAIHLHCDADTIGGKIPQSLYTGLGYEMIEDKSSPYAWMGSELATKIYMVQGVALLYLRKKLL